jgi:hypothetical protein
LTDTGETIGTQDIVPSAPTLTCRSTQDQCGNLFPILVTVR